MVTRLVKLPVAQTVPFAVCGFSYPNDPKAADLPEMREVCATSTPSFFEMGV